jgi:putative DNA primase/helicase
MVDAALDAAGIGADDVVELRPPPAAVIDLAETARRQRPQARRSEPDGPVLECAANIRPMPIRWLWPGWLAAGKLHILAGQPGQGKTTLALAVAAALSRGGPWPDGVRGGAQWGDTLIWSGEDDPADTLVPRLMAMGADLEQITFVRGTRINGELTSFDPARDLVGLTAAAGQLRGLKLMIVDPVVASVSGDSHKNTEVRRALQPLVDLAMSLDAAVLGITHFSKSSAGRDPVERVTGSVAFGAVARVVMVAAKVARADGDRRVLARAKSNIGPDDGGIEYALRLQDVANRPGLRATAVQWGALLPGTARELLADAEQQPDDEDNDIDGFLRGVLADGPVAANTALSEGTGAGYSRDQVLRAARRLGVKRTKTGMRGGWDWSLPGAEECTAAPKNAKNAPPADLHSSHSSHSSAGGTAPADADDCPF